MTELPRENVPDDPDEVLSEEPEAEEYEPTDTGEEVSEETGTLYDERGEAEVTPQDLEPEEPEE